MNTVSKEAATEGGVKRWFKPSSSGLTSFFLLGPAVVYLFVWMIIPLGMTIYYSFRKYNLIQPYIHGFAGFSNYANVLADPNFLAAFFNTLVLVIASLILTVVLGLFFAVLYNNEHVFGRNLIRTFAASPFFIMPVVTGLIWKNLMMNPSFGLLSALWRGMGSRAG